jgi:hypothetical protein
LQCGFLLGSPVSAVIANLVMEDVEQRSLASVPVSLSFWKRFVDDVISAVSGNEIDIFLQHLNSIEPCIQFTIEREMNRHLVFLDLGVHRTVEGKLETDVCRKPTRTNKYLSYLTLGHIFEKPKDPVKTNQKTHGVFSLPYGDCEKKYFGQFKRQFGKRLKEDHKAVATLLNKDMTPNTRLRGKILK